MVATRRSQKAAQQYLSVPKRTFADLPNEIIVAIARWLPCKDIKREGQARRHVPPDQASLSLLDTRTRAILVRHVLYERLNLKLATYEHLKELRDRPEWLSGVKDFRVCIAVRIRLETSRWTICL